MTATANLSFDIEDYTEISAAEFDLLRAACRRLVHTASSPKSTVLAYFTDFGHQPDLLKIKHYSPFQFYRRRQ